MLIMTDGVKYENLTAWAASSSDEMI